MIITIYFDETFTGALTPELVGSQVFRAHGARTRTTEIIKPIHSYEPLRLFYTTAGVGLNDTPGQILSSPSDTVAERAL